MNFKAKNDCFGRVPLLVVTFLLAQASWAQSANYKPIVDRAGWVSNTQYGVVGYDLQAVQDGFWMMEKNGGKFVTPAGLDPATRNLIFRTDVASGTAGSGSATASLARDPATGTYYIISAVHVLAPNTTYRLTNELGESGVFTTPANLYLDPASGATTTRDYIRIPAPSTITGLPSVASALSRPSAVPVLDPGLVPATGATVISLGYSAIYQLPDRPNNPVLVPTVSAMVGPNSGQGPFGDYTVANIVGGSNVLVSQGHSGSPAYALVGGVPHLVGVGTSMSVSDFVIASTGQATVGQVLNFTRPIYGAQAPTDLDAFNGTQTAAFTYLGTNQFPKITSGQTLGDVFMPCSACAQSSDKTMFGQDVNKSIKDWAKTLYESTWDVTDYRLYRRYSTADLQELKNKIYGRYTIFGMSVSQETVDSLAGGIVSQVSSMLNQPDSLTAYNELGLSSYDIAAVDYRLPVAGVRFGETSVTVPLGGSTAISSNTVAISTGDLDAESQRTDPARVAIDDQNSAAWFSRSLTGFVQNEGFYGNSTLMSSCASAQVNVDPIGCRQSVELQVFSGISPADAQQAADYRQWLKMQPM